MKYDLDKLVDETTIELQWHGEPTKVLIKGNSEKTEVNTGDVLAFPINQARELLRYSYLWTKSGDKPVKHQYNEVALPNSLKGQEIVEESDESTDENESVDLSSINYEDKKQVVAALKFLKVSFNDRQGVKKLADLLREELVKNNAPEVAEGEVTDQGIAHYVTEEDLVNNSELAEQGIKVGDLIYLPEESVN